MNFDLDSFGPEWRPAFECVERSVGGWIVRAERQARWRPVFWIDVETPDGEILPVCFRGGRIEQGDEVLTLAVYLPPEQRGAKPKSGALSIARPASADTSMTWSA